MCVTILEWDLVAHGNFPQSTEMKFIEVLDERRRMFFFFLLDTKKNENILMQMAIQWYVNGCLK